MIKIFYIFTVIAIFLSFSGCGYKANPYYESVAESDENVEFKIKETN
ncbi:MAG: hypothetical protein U9N02_03290 [Campylobacterota bacterium]|nr:hypothetical protein [Campylobacterota bacterium]